MRRRLRPSGYAIFLLGLLAAIGVVPIYGGFYQAQVVAFGMIYVQLALGLSLVSGYAGQISLGQSGFFALGAYAAALSSVRFGLPMGVGVAIGIVLPGVAGLVVGLPSLRIRGLYLAIVTLMFSMIVETLLTNLPSVTGGVLGISAIPRPTLPIAGRLSNVGYYYFLVAITTAMTLGCMVLVRSPVGWKFIAIRDDESAAQMLGIPTSRYKLLAFLLSAGLAGLAGGLYAHYVGFISPEVFPGSLSITLLMMIIIGGMRQVEGALLGALLVGVLPEVLRFTQNFWNIIFGGLIIAVIVLVPDGLIALPRRAWRPRLHPQRSAQTSLERVEAE